MEAFHSHPEGIWEGSLEGKVMSGFSSVNVCKRTLCSFPSRALKKLLLFVFLLCPVIGLFVTLPCVPCIRVFDTLPSIVLQENCCYSSFCLSWTRCPFKGLPFPVAHLEHRALPYSWLWLVISLVVICSFSPLLSHIQLLSQFGSLLLEDGSITFFWNVDTNLP